MKKMNFVWEMTEKQWEQLKHDHKKTGKPNKHAGYYGDCCIGSLKADIQHTLDTADWYPFSNIFAYGIDSKYVTTSDGTPYSLLNNSPAIPMKSKSFQAFKKNFENNFTNYIKDNNLSQLTETDIPNWD